MKLIRRIAIAIVLVATSTPLWGYVVILKDGTEIITKEKYRRDGDKVVLVLTSGTETFIDASEVDFEKTDELNTVNIGQARLIEQRADTVIVEEQESRQRLTLRELAGRTALSLPDAEQQEISEDLPLTQAGFVDLWNLERAAHPNLEVTGEIGRALKSKGAERFKIFRGTTASSVLVEMVANSEAAMFKNLRDAAAALVQARSNLSRGPSELELVMSTDAGSRAGQFVLTEDLSNRLLSGSVDIPTFFYRYVQF